MFSMDPLSIDIGSSAIKMVDYTTSFGNISTKIGIKTLPNSAINDGEIVNTNLVKESLNFLLESLKIKPKKRSVNLAISGRNVQIRKLEYGRNEISDLDTLLNLEAEQYFNCNRNYLKLGWRILEKNNDRDSTSVLVTAAKTKNIAAYTNLVYELGLRPNFVGCDTFSVFNLVNSLFKEQHGFALICDLGASYSRAIITKDRIFQNSYDLSICGDSYTESISTFSNYDFDTSESKKISIDNSCTKPNDQRSIVECIQRLSSILILELESILEKHFHRDYFEDYNYPITSIFLSGGPAETIYLRDMIANAFRVPCIVIDPLQQLNPSRMTLSNSTNYGNSSFSTSMGLLASFHSNRRSHKRSLVSW